MAGFSVTISAVDQVSGTLDKVNRKLKSFSAPYEKLNASVKQFGDTSGLNRVGKAFGDIGRSAADAFHSVTRIVEPLGVIAGVASIAGMYKLVSAWADWGSRLGYTAERIGTTAGRLNDFQNAARLAGVSAEAMTGGMTHLKDAMTDALAGRNNEAMQYFQRLGISMKSLHGTAESVLPQIVAKIGQLEKTNPTLAARVTSSIFGSEELLRLFRGGLPAFQAYIAQAQKLGGVTDDQVAKADQLRQSQTALTVAVEQFGYKVAADLQPVIGPVLDFMTQWIAANGKFIAQDIAAEVKAFVEYLKGLDWQKIRQDFDGWYNSVKRVVDKLGGLQAVVRDVLLLMAGSFVLKLTSPFFALAGALDGVIFKMGRMVLAARAAQGAAAAAVEGGAAAAAGGATTGAAGVAAAEGGAAAAGVSGLGLVTPILIGAAVTGTIAYLTAHGLSWLFGGGWNDPGAKGPTANAANRGHDRNQEIHSSSGPQRGGPAPRGFRNNNPLNLTYVPGQKGLTGSDGRFGQYGSMADGVAAAENQLLLNQNRGADTLTAQITKWAPANENDTKGYIAKVAGETGLDPNAPLDMRDPTVASKVIAAMTRHENGKDIDPRDINSGVRAAIGAGGPPASMPTAAAPGSDGANGKVVVEVHAGDGTKAAVKHTSGNVKAAAPKGVASSSIGMAYAI